MAIKIKGPSEIEKLRAAGKIVSDTHLYLKEFIKEGISTYELDELAEKFIRKQGGIPSFKDYEGFPATICTSINEQVVHGIPSKDVILKEGDIVSVDIGACYKGYHGDAARTHPVGQVSEIAKELMKVTEESFWKGLEAIKDGNRLYGISSAVQNHVEKHGFSVVRDLVGHGVGKDLHEEPQIPNYKPVGRGIRLRAGMVIAVEPMVNVGDYMIEVLNDDWTIVTLDRSLSSHYENTLLVTKSGYELLTEV